MFRTVELTSAKDFVNYAVQQFISGRFRFEEYWTDGARNEVIIDDHPFNVAWHLHTPIGEFHRDDVVLVVEADNVLVGAVNRFFESENDFVVDLNCFQAERPGVWRDWVINAPLRIFVQASRLSANLQWARRNDRAIRVVLPAALNLA